MSNLSQFKANYKDLFSKMLTRPFSIKSNQLENEIFNLEYIFKDHITNNNTYRK